MDEAKTASGALTPQAACEALREVGVVCAPEDVQISDRDERWAVMLPAGRIAWFPKSKLARDRLAVERRVLSLLAQRCSFSLPKVLLVSASGIDVRQSVPGRCDPWDLYQRCKEDSKLAQRIGRSIGSILAEQHMKTCEADVAGWLRRRVDWPKSSNWIRERLPHVVNDVGFARVMEDVMARYEAVPVGPDDRALIHGDVGFHNLALDSETDQVNGIFDYDSAAWADRHHDFRYLIFDIEREDVLEAALDVYEPAIDRTINRDRIRLYNAACAISYLAFRLGVSADAKSCGRTLAEDVQWVRSAVSKLA